MINNINNIVWIVTTILIVFVGIYFGISLKFPQFKFKKIIKSFNEGNTNKKGLDSFKSLTLALGARIGVGSLSGIAIGIVNGGPGVVFWLWLSCLLCIPNSFVESSLAVKFHERDGEFFKGGPAYYIRKGLHNNWLANLYAVVLAFCYLGGLLAIQCNTIAASVSFEYNIRLIVGIIVGVLTFIVIYKGLSSISEFSAKFVPFMGIIYMLFAFIFIIINIKNLPMAIVSIFREAFNFKAFGWGLLSSAIVIGVQRGVVSSECGIGTGAIASGTSDSKVATNQGYLQMFGVYFTIFVVCTSTALIVLTSGINTGDFIGTNGIELLSSALTDKLGVIGEIGLIFAVISFAFSTILSGYYYGENNVKYLFGKLSKKTLLFLKLFVLAVLIYGAVMNPSDLWDIVDIGIGILSLINVYALFRLRKEMKEEME